MEAQKGDEAQFQDKAQSKWRLCNSIGPLAHVCHDLLYLHILYMSMNDQQIEMPWKPNKIPRK